MRNNDDHPLRLGGRRFTGPAKYVATALILAAVALIYVAISRWLQQRSSKPATELYGDGIYLDQVTGE